MKHMRIKRGFVAAMWFTALVTHGEVKADYLWLQVEGPQVNAYAGDLLKPLAKLPAFADAKVVNADGKEYEFQKAGDHYSFDESIGKDARFSATFLGSNGVLIYHQARFGRQEIKPVHELELVPDKPGGDTFRLFFKGNPVAASQVNVATSEGWRRVLQAGTDGSVNFKPWFPGFYVMEVTARVNNGSVTLDGRKFDDVRHSATLSFEVRY
jgi:hypothetical protein